VKYQDGHFGILNVMKIFPLIAALILPTKNALLRQSTNTVVKATKPEKDKERKERFKESKEERKEGQGR